MESSVSVRGNEETSQKKGEDLDSRDLSINNISKIPVHAFLNLTELEALRLAGNNLTSLPAGVFDSLRNLRSLHLEENNFVQPPVEALQAPLSRLHILHLGNNRIKNVPAESFRRLSNVAQLWLDQNDLTEVPWEALNNVPSLQALTLAENRISKIDDYSFTNMSNLGVLLLFKNGLQTIADHAFEGLINLKILEIDKNNLREIPVALASLPELQELSLSDNKLEYLPDQSFVGNKKMTRLVLKKNPIMSVGTRAFANLPQFENLVLSEARDQEEFPDLSGTFNLKRLSLDRGSIKSIPEDMCQKVWRLQSFDIHSNRISSVPDLSGCKELRTLNLGNNELTTLDGQLFQGLTQLRDLTLAHNYIHTVPEDAFHGLVNLQYLDLQHNKITHIHNQAFALLKNLEDLNLGENMFSHLPTAGLENLRNLKTFNNRELKEFPSPETFPRITILTLSYAYHCCEFIKLQEQRPDDPLQFHEDIIFLSKPNMDNALWKNLTNILGPLENMSANYNSFIEDIYESFGTDYDINYPKNIPSPAAHYFSDYKPKYDAEDFYIAKPPITCKPMPGPFMPCDDLMGWWSLRCGVWVVFLLALLGNGCVLSVSVVSRSKMDVTRFLICNLASADFFMGIYLGFLAIVDASTLGEFKMYAIQWQTSAGCLVAGFLGVLSSELSVFTLTVITIERFYAITHAMHLNKRLSLRHAAYIMACGWFFALLMASMPLFGVSDYRKFAVCLPFEIGDPISLGYVCFIMLVNCSAFMVIVSCYTKMYCSIRGSQAWNSNDSRVAKRMALLVFTDFACWAPISFFSLSAAFGWELIALNDAKIFTIFVLPLNSCANPFLYAIFTKQFKKDCSTICKRLEESAMSRSLSRLSNRNLSFSWGSSRRPSVLNSFFVPGEKQRQSRSNSISGASAAQLDSHDHGSSTNRSSSHNFIKHYHDEMERMVNVPITKRNQYLCSCFSGTSSPDVPPHTKPKVRGPRSKYLMDRPDMLHRCDPSSSDGRTAPVGASAGLLSMINRRKGVDKIGDGMDSDQEEGVKLRQDIEPLGMLPLSSMRRSPARGHNMRHNTHSPYRKVPRVRTTTPPIPGKKSSITLNCCNGTPKGAAKSQGPEYQLMIHSHTDSAERKDQSSTSGTAEASVNNNHEYINVTEDMISELQKIRTISSTSDSSLWFDSKEVNTGSFASKSEDTGFMDNVRLDPEGSECEEKPMYVPRGSPKHGPNVKGCQCHTLNGSHREISPIPFLGSSDSNGNHGAPGLLDPLDPRSRESWICGTGRTPSPHIPFARSRRRDLFQKSSSFDLDQRPSPAEFRLGGGVVSTSLPVLSPDDPGEQLFQPVCPAAVNRQCRSVRAPIARQASLPHPGPASYQNASDTNLPSSDFRLWCDDHLYNARSNSTSTPAGLSRNFVSVASPTPCSSHFVYKSPSTSGNTLPASSPSTCSSPFPTSPLSPLANSFPALSPSPSLSTYSRKRTCPIRPADVYSTYSMDSLSTRSYSHGHKKSFSARGFLPSGVKPHRKEMTPQCDVLPPCDNAGHLYVETRVVLEQNSPKVTLKSGPIGSEEV